MFLIDPFNIEAFEQLYNFLLAFVDLVIGVVVK